jgi:catechol 2,3-dioxygenase-like lactoylglutathione lyase family enzyme
MPITAMHHFNVRVDALELVAVQKFYCEVLGFRVGPRPPFRSIGAWLYAGELPLLHLTQSEPALAFAAASSPAAGEDNQRRSSIDHIALAAEDLDQTLQHLTAHGIEFRRARVPGTGDVQLFLHDPVGNGIELVFQNAVPHTE